MASKSPNRWFLILGSQKNGPFTLKELQTMLSRGEIAPTSRVVLSRNGTRNETKDTTVSELIKNRSDPTYTLLDAFEAAKRKLASQRESFHRMTQLRSTSDNPLRIPSRIHLKALTLMALLALCVALFRISRQASFHPHPHLQPASEGSHSKLRLLMDILNQSDLHPSPLSGEAPPPLLQKQENMTPDSDPLSSPPPPQEPSPDDRDVPDNPLDSQQPEPPREPSHWDSSRDPDDSPPP